ncbi:hypothetical protein GCM10028857_08700 [Salinarchaeum chitinilyticum]
MAAYSSRSIAYSYQPVTTLKGVSDVAARMAANTTTEQDPGPVRWVRVLVALGFLLLFFGVAGYTLWSGNLGTGPSDSTAVPSGVDAPPEATNQTGETDGDAPAADDQDGGMAGEGENSAVNRTTNETGTAGDTDAVDDVGEGVFRAD